MSISVAPMLLSASPAPVFATTRRMSLKRLFRTSPLGCIGTFLLGAIFAAQFGMGPVFATSWRRDGERLLTGSGDGTVRIWNLSALSDVLVLERSADWVYRAAWSPDGRQIATSSFDTWIWRVMISLVMVPHSCLATTWQRPLSASSCGNVH